MLLEYKTRTNTVHTSWDIATIQFKTPQSFSSQCKI